MAFISPGCSVILMYIKSYAKPEEALVRFNNDTEVPNPELFYESLRIKPVELNFYNCAAPKPPQVPSKFDNTLCQLPFIKPETLLVFSTPTFVSNQPRNLVATQHRSLAGTSTLPSYHWPHSAHTIPQFPSEELFNS